MTRALIETLGRAVLREDADFHDYQELEGAGASTRRSSAAARWPRGGRWWR